MRSGVNITDGSVGADASTDTDSISALLAGGIAIEDSVALGQVVTVYSLKQAEALGFDAAYDSASNVRVYRHIAEHYRMGGDGKELNIMLYPQTTDPADAFGAAYGQKLVTQCAGRIRRLALAHNPATGYTATSLDGFEAKTRAAIPAAQVFADWSANSFRALHVIVEGRLGATPTASAALNLRNIQLSGNTIEYNQVSVMIGQDWTYANGLDAIGKGMADVGTLLGALASGKVNENPGEVGRVNVTDTRKSKWLVAGISGNIKIADIDADLDTWNQKGYILCWDYNDVAAPGYRFNSDHVCAPIIEDADNNLNVSSIALSCTNIKVKRLLRSAYLPKVNSVEKLDKATGKLPPGVVKTLNKVGNDVFGEMEDNSEISGGTTAVDPNSNLLTGDKILNVAYSWQPLGTIGQINGLVNIKSQLS